jgi:hypothetical protein
MPQVFEPVHKFDEFKELKKANIKRLLAERVALYQQKKAIEDRLDGNEQEGIESLNLQVFVELRAVLPDDVSSVDFDGYIISAYQGKPQERLDVNELLTKTFKCAHCKEPVVLPAKVVDSCRHEGKIPKPTVSVRKVKEA